MMMVTAIRLIGLAPLMASVAGRRAPAVALAGEELSFALQRIDRRGWWQRDGGRAQIGVEVAGLDAERHPQRERARPKDLRRWSAVSSASPKKAEKEVTPDDLTVIKGIGPSVQEKLRSLGIKTFKDLARADPDRLVDQLKTSLPVSKARIRGWTEVARERTEARA